MKNVKDNIQKMYLIKALRWFLLIMPIVVLFFQDNGLSMTEVLLLQSIFSVAIVLFEIPSGFFSDVMGRKNTIIIGLILGFLGYMVYVMSYGFWGFLLAELILGLGSSFISGTDSAIIYDSLVQINKEHEYKKIEGRMLAYGNFSEGIASIIGGLLALISLRTPFYIEAIIVALAIPIAFTLVEPSRQKYKNTEGSFREILKIVKYAMHGHPRIKWLIIYAGLLGSSTLTMVWFIQPYLKNVGVPLVLFGVAWAVLNFSVGIFSLLAHNYEKFLGLKKSLSSLVFLVFVAYLVLGIWVSVWSIGFIIIFYFVRGVSQPILKDYLNKLITSDIRATVLSVKQMFGRLAFVVIGPFVGWVADIYTIPTALLLSGFIFLFLGILPLFFLKKHKIL